MVVNQFNAMGMALDPLETNPPLVIHANAVLPCTIAAQPFQAVAWR